jgi:hypothetical protein
MTSVSPTAANIELIRTFLPEKEYRKAAPESQWKTGRSGDGFGFVGRNNEP